MCPPAGHLPSSRVLLVQAWIAAIADKLEVSLEGYKVPGVAMGFGDSPKAAGGKAKASS
jgi:hypothetical protein